VSRRRWDRRWRGWPGLWLVGAGWRTPEVVQDGPPDAEPVVLVGQAEPPPSKPAAKMTAVVHFETGELQVIDKMLGVRQRIDYRGHNCEIVFPAVNDDFGIHGGYAPGVISWCSSHGDMDTYLVRVLRVIVELDGDLLASDFDCQPSGSRRALIDRAIGLLDEAIAVGRNLLSIYLGHIRADLGQFWLGSSMQKPQVAGDTQLLDTAGQMIPVGRTLQMTGMVRGVDLAVSTAFHDRTVDKVRAEEAPSLAESLLRDAQKLSWETDQVTVTCAKQFFWPR